MAAAHRGSGITKSADVEVLSLPFNLIELIAQTRSRDEEAARPRLGDVKRITPTQEKETTHETEMPQVQDYRRITPAHA